MTKIVKFFLVALLVGAFIYKNTILDEINTFFYVKPKLTVNMKVADIIALADDEFQPIKKMVVYNLKKIEEINESNYKTAVKKIKYSIDNALISSKLNIDRAANIFKDYKQMLEDRKSKTSVRSLATTSEMEKEIEENISHIEEQIEVINDYERKFEYLIGEIKSFLTKAQEIANFYVETTAYSDDVTANKMRVKILEVLKNSSPDLYKIYNDTSWLNDDSDPVDNTENLSNEKLEK